MLDFNDVNVAGAEISWAEKEIDKRLATTRRQINSYVSGYFRSTHGNGEDGQVQNAPENEYFEVAALMLPRLAHANPQLAVESSRGGVAKVFAIAEKHAGNRWVKDSRFVDLMGELAMDYLFNFAAVRLSVAENPLANSDRQELIAEWPELERISPEDYFCDVRAKGPTLRRFEGHKTLVDKDDLLASAAEELREDPDAGWDLEAIRGVPDNDAGSGDGRKRKEQSGAPERKQVCVLSVWVPGYEDKDHQGPDEGEYGSIFTYARSSSEKENQGLILIRKPYAYFGGPEGPYYTASEYPVPDDPLGLSSLVAGEGQIRDLNTHAKAVSGKAERAKNLTLVDDTDPEFADRVKEAPDDEVLVLSGLADGKAMSLPVGGVPPESVAYLELIRDRVDRTLGISQMMRGVADGEATATAAALAGTAGDSRVAWIQSRFVRFLERVLTGVLRHIHCHDDVIVPVPEEGIEEMRREMLNQGLTPEDVEAMLPEGEALDLQGDMKTAETFADLELRIDLISIEHQSEQVRMRRAQMASDYLTMKGQTAIMAPWINHKEDCRVYGEAIGVPDLADRWDQQLYEELVARQLMLEIQGQGATPDAHMAGQGPEPRTSGPSPLREPTRSVSDGFTPTEGGGGLAGQSSGATLGNLAQGAAQTA